jgi:hypothetical protein
MVRTPLEILAMCEKEPLGPAQDRNRKDDWNQRGIRHALSHPFRQAWRAFQYVDGAYLRGHPELELFPTERQRRRALGRVVSKFLWRPAFWWAVAKTMAFAVLLALSVFALITSLRRWYSFPIGAALPWAVVPVVLVIGIAVFFGNRWLRRCVPELLRHELLDCGVPICIACGYPLFRLPGPNCPECGTPFNEQARQILEVDAGPARAEAAGDDADEHNSRRRPTT